MPGKIVVATDGSRSAGVAVDRAAELSDKLGRDLCIVHVQLHGRPPREMRHLAGIEHLIAVAKAPDAFMRPGLSALGRSAEEEAENARVIVAIGDDILATARQRAEDRGARGVTTRICAGDYADEILDVAETEHADMIVVGSRGLGRLSEALLGSVSQKILHHAACSVIVVR